MAEKKNELYQYPLNWCGKDYFLVWFAIAIFIAVFFGSISILVAINKHERTRQIEMCINHNVPLDNCQ